jgi:hypothetical protein
VQFVFNDGGREASGFNEPATGGCVVRAIAIATGKPYREVFHALQNGLRHQIEVERLCSLKYGIKGDYRPTATPPGGLCGHVFGPYLRWLGWEYVVRPVGTNGKPLRLRDGALPSGRLIVLLSNHLVAVIDGTLHDTFNSALRGQRPIYGYFHKKAADRPP